MWRQAPGARRAVWVGPDQASMARLGMTCASLARGACGRAGAAGQLIGPRGRGVFVVFANEQHRQVKNTGPIQALQERSTIDRAIPEEAHHDVGRAQHFLRFGV